MNITELQLNFKLNYVTHFGEEVFIHFNTPLHPQTSNSNKVKLVYKNALCWEKLISIPSDALLDKKIIYYYSIEVQNEIKYISDNYEVTVSKKMIEKKLLVLNDEWVSNTEFKLFFNQPCFTEILLAPIQHTNKTLVNKGNCNFYVKDYVLKANQKIAIIGNLVELNNWDLHKKPLLLQYEVESKMYQIQLNLPFKQQVEYKYIIIDDNNHGQAHFEMGENRTISVENSAYYVFHDGFVRKAEQYFRGVGVAIPIFSLRSKKSGGIGEFNDLKSFADWGKKLGLKMIQILPINDTTALFNWKDSYPYSAISVFALHPIYLHLDELFSIKLSEQKKSYLQETQQLNVLEDIAYEKVLSVKWKYIKIIYDDVKSTLINDAHFLDFIKGNLDWMMGYSYFCYYRNMYQSADWTSWPKKIKNEKPSSDFFYSELFKNAELTIHVVVQYWLHLQLLEASQYINKLGLILKGDLAIGVAYNSSDVWQHQDLFKLQFQAGAPPDDFSEYGQNWGFPTYHWELMKKTNYQWWRSRFEKMQTYFQAFRIDHILGFFRIWSIPKNEVQGLLGYFDPTIPVKPADLVNSGIYIPIERLTEPFINEEILDEIFQQDKEFVKSQFLDYINSTQNYNFKAPFTGQKAILHFLKTKYPTYFTNEVFIEKIFSLYANKILLPAEDNEHEFHFRFFMQRTFSFKYLPYDQQEKLVIIYNNYFFERAENLWEQNARKKLPALKAATNMLICGEDLGLVPQCVPKLMKELNILNLEVQRMPNNNSISFNYPERSAYLCVVTPSSHDTSTLRGWWEEHPSYLATFYYDYLQLSGELPSVANEQIIKKILEKHVYSPAMWAVFQLQDILTLESSFHKGSPELERINIPAIAEHYWKYRMPILIENLMREESLNTKFKAILEQAQRI